MILSNGVQLYTQKKKNRWGMTPKTNGARSSSHTSAFDDSISPTLQETMYPARHHIGRDLIKRTGSKTARKCLSCTGARVVLRTFLSIARIVKSGL